VELQAILPHKIKILSVQEQAMGEQIRMDIAIL